MKTKQKKKKKKKASSKRRKERSTKSSTESSVSWVDHVCLEPITNDETSDYSNKPSLSLISWNVLAEGYCSHRSHPGLPRQYAKEVFDRPRRRNRIRHILEQLVADESIDVICLQEVDLDDIGKHLSQLGYEGLETPRSKRGGVGRIDACGIYVNTKHWTVVDHELIQLDDLGTLIAQNNNDNDENNNDTTNSITSVAGNLQGLQQSFLRRKTALLVRLQHVVSSQTIVIANGHLYWNPGYEYVKLCQAHYILQCAKRFCNNDNNEPFVLCGDFNSRPHGVAHSYLTHGFINAKRVAPWYAQSHPDEEIMEEEEEVLVNGMTKLQLKDHSDETLVVRYILDATLNKLCRWLRILGLDTALETEEEEKLRTNDGQMILFDRARHEKRTLVTTSTRLMRRRDCPAGAYCINPTVLPNLEVAMVHMLLTHGVVLEPSTFLGRCVVCNGNIIELEGNHESRRILEKYEAPLDLMDENFEVYECDNCQQGYWWCDRPTSSASRVKNTATRLFQVCLRAGVPIRGKVPDMLNGINVQEERERGWDFEEKGSELLRQKLDVVDWLRDEQLACPFELESAYALKDDNGTVLGELLPFTNVTSGFVNTLDYIFFDKKQLQLSERLYVPKSFAELNCDNIEKGHLLPSDVWPSDHLAIGARLTFASDEAAASVSDEERGAALTVPAVSNGPIAQPSLPPSSTAPAETNIISEAQQGEVAGEFCLPATNGQPPPPPFPAAKQHGKRCDCGCVPNILSMFEMAELRKQARLKKQQQEKEES